MIRSMILAVALSAPGSIAASAATSTNDSTLLADVQVETGTGEVLIGVDLLIRNGVIEAIGADLERPWDATVIEGDGLVVVPGFIDAFSVLLTAEQEAGGEEGSSAGSTPDEGAAWRMDPHHRSALQPEARVVDQLSDAADGLAAHRKGGFTTVLAVPRAAGLAGRSALVQLGNARQLDRLLFDDVAQHFSFRTTRGDYPSTVMGLLAQTRQFLLDARRNQELWEHYRRNNRRVRRPSLDPAYRSVWPALAGEQLVVIEADSAREIRRALAFAAEFGLRPYIAGGAQADRVIDELRAAGAAVLLGLDFPDEVEGLPEEEEHSHDVTGPILASGADDEAKPAPEPNPTPRLALEDQRRRRQERIRTAALLAEAGVPFALTTRGLKDAAEFHRNLRLAIEAGLSRSVALSALTFQSARLLGAGGVVGALRPGLAADLAVYEGEPLSAEARLTELFIAGERIELDSKNGDSAVSEGRRGRSGSGRPGRTGGRRRSAAAEGETEKEDKPAPAPLVDLPVETDADRNNRLVTGGDLLVRHATIHTVTGPAIDNGWILLRAGQIAGVGREGVEPVPVLDGSVAEIDASGLHVTPGIIDCHSHIAISGGVNESTRSITAEVRIDEEVDGDSVSIYRALAGGCTTANLLHGSANAIGGQNAVIKLKYRRPASELLFEGAPRGIKFALGENPKRSSSQGRSSTTPPRYPVTRMGVEAVIRRSFDEARRYQVVRDEYHEAVARGEDPVPPRRDLRLETLAGILDGSVRVHSHSYRADEILMLIRLAEEYGFRIATFQHVLEGYKVAPELARHGAGASTFSDWWAYKAEAYDAIPYNAALMTRAGVVVSLNSDSSELMRRLNLEAAKAMKYGGLDEVEALALVTLNPARQLGIDARVGSIEVGKDGDLALWSGHPLSTYSRCEWTVVDGEVEFQRQGQPSALDLEVAVAEPVSGETGSEGAVETGPIPRQLREPAMTDERHAIVGARIVPVSSPVIERGVVLVRDGLIEAVGADLAVPEGYRVHDASGLHLFPGMIDTATQLGLTEIGSVAGTVDQGERARFQPDLRTAVAINPASDHIPVARVNGITSAVVRPGGGLLSGQSALVRLDGWTWEQMTLVDPLALHVQVPGQRRRWRRSSEPDRSAEQQEELLAFFAEAEELSRQLDAAEAAGAEAPLADPRLAALRPYLAGERPVMFHTQGVKGIRSMLKLVDRLKVRPILVGGREAWKLADELARRDVPVLFGPVLANPSQQYDPYDASFAAAAVLERAGVRFAFQTDSSSNVRNLPYHAAMAAAYGLDRDAALAAVTLRPAQILGIDHRLGSIEPGKIADLVLADGDLLEIRTNVLKLFIHGRQVALDSRHTRLYERYAERLSEIEVWPESR